MWRISGSIGAVAGAMVMTLSLGAPLDAAAHPAHRCVARASHGCPNQHRSAEQSLVHAKSIRAPVGGLAGAGGKRKHHRVTVQKTNDSSSTTLYQAQH
jgi:hypothetical protein